MVKIESKKVPTLPLDRGGEGVKSYLGHAYKGGPHSNIAKGTTDPRVEFILPK